MTRQSRISSDLPTILHVIDTGGPGGAETIFARLSADIRDEGFRSVAVVSRKGWLADHLNYLGLDPVILDSKGSVQVSYLCRLVQLIKERDVRCVVAHLYGAGLYSAMAGCLARIPVIVVLHGQSDVSDSQRLSAIKHFLLRRCATRVVFVSDALKADLQPRLGLRDRQCEVIPNGVDMSRFDSNTRDSAPSDAVTIGAVGNIRGPKAYDVLLKAARIVLDRQPEVRFEIAGEGSGALMTELSGLRDKLGLSEKLTFRGPVADVSGFLRQIDIFASSSKTEGFSLALVEAMAAGLPVVATRSGGPETIIDSDECGKLVPTQDPEGLASALLALIDDPARRLAMGKAARQRVESRFALDRMTAAYARLIRSSIH